MTARLRATIAVVALLVTAACSSGSTPGEPEAAPTSPASEPSAESSTRDLLSSRGIGIVTLHAAAEGGSHPTLSWDPFDGAASYWLVLKDDEGRPYWGWTGTETSVRVGGGTRAEQNQTAVLFEPMTWSVSAFDADGRLVAISEPQTVAP